MTQYFWFGGSGSLNNGNDWIPGPVVPGPNDYVVIAASGTISLTGSLSVARGDMSADIAGGIFLAGNLTTGETHIGGNPNPQFNGTVTVQSGFTLSTAQLAMQSGTINVKSGGAVTVGPNVSAVSGAVHVGGIATLVGDGKIDGNLIIDAGGSITAGNGKLLITGSASGAGLATIGDNAILEFGAAAAVTVDFGGISSRTLKLDQPALFTGTLANMTNADVVDLTGTAVASALVKNAMLTVTDAGAHTFAYPMTGLFTRQHFVVTADGAGGSNLTVARQEVADFDLQGSDDVLFQSHTSGQLIFATMSFGNFTGWKAATSPLGDYAVGGYGDVNGDGFSDVFVQGQGSASIYAAEQKDTGTPTWIAVSTSLTTDWKLAGVGDLDGEGHADAVVQQQSTGTIYYASMANGAFAGWGVVAANLTPDWKVAGVGDVTGDGFADVVVQQQSTGTTYFANMAHGVFSGWGVVTGNVTSAWKVKAVADVTGDGFADVVFQNQAIGTTYHANMANGVFSGWNVVAQNIDATWVAKSATDIDHDGRADIVFQHSTDGTTYYTHMGVVGVTPEWGVVATNIGTDWHVA